MECGLRNTAKVLSEVEMSFDPTYDHFRRNKAGKADTIM
jgi:hypothetical protein